MPIKIGTGSSAVEPSELRLGLFSRPAVRVMVGTGNDAVPAYVRQVPPLEPKTVGSTTKTFIPDYKDYGLFATFRVTGGGKGRFKVSLNGPYIDDYAGSFQRIFSIRINGSNVASWGKNTNKSDWIITNQLSDEIEIPENVTVEIWLQISTSNQSDRYLNSWSVELIPSEVEEPVDPEEPIETVVITGTSWGESQAQLRDALTARGLDYQTVETLPFDLDTSQATNLQGLFQGCAALTEVPEMDTSNVTNMNNMFSECSSLTSVPEMDTSQVTSMVGMYGFNPSLVEVPEMDTSNVTTMSYMFSWCTALAYVPDMDTENVTDMSYMFNGCGALTDGNVRLFGKHPDVNTASMIEMSGLTVEPFFVPAVETQTALSVVPSEVTEGESISLTATVTPADAVGSVTFSVAGETSVVEVVEGVAATTLTVDQIGSHEVTADFIPADTDDFIASVDTAWITVHEFVPAVETTTVLTVDPTEVIVGDSVTVTATVTPSDAEGYVVLGMQGGGWHVDVVDGVATTTNETYIVGDQEYTASFVPTNPEDFTPSSAEPVVVTTLPVPAVETTTVLTVAPDEITEGEQVTLTATVTPSEAVGEVVFTVGTQTLIAALEGGTASTTFTLDTPGVYGATAEFVPSSVEDFLPSSDTFQITVLESEPVETTTTLSVVPDEIEEGELVTVTATVTPVEAEGVVEFDVAGQLSTVNVVNGEAVATATLDEAGEHAITADFIPANEADFLSSSATGSVTVVEGGGAALEPMEWSYSGSTVNNPPTTEVTLVNYTVVGTGVASIYTAVSASGYRFLQTRVGISRTIRVYVNGDEVGSASHTSDQTAWLTETFTDIELRDGDTFEVTHQVVSGTARARRNWTISITPQ